MAETEIAGRRVPIEPGPRSIIRFSGGRGGTDEAGDWEFWVAGKTIARCRPDADPGERFRRMEGASGYESLWTKARAADHIRPATVAELEKWLDAHADDARHATTGEIGGAKIRVVSEGGRYRVVRDAP